MSVPAPHYRLISEVALAPAAAFSRSGEHGAAGQWRFVLQADDGRTCLEATDGEDQASAERLELLAIVRGLEALDEPARVTLATPSRTVRRSLRQGLEHWRENDWQWERYGKWTPVKNGDLWRRIDRAMAIHAVECQPAQLDAVDDLAPLEFDSGPQVVLSRRTIAGRRIRIDGVAVGGAADHGGHRSARPFAGGPTALKGWFAGLVQRLFDPRPRP